MPYANGHFQNSALAAGSSSMVKFARLQKSFHTYDLIRPRYLIQNGIFFSFMNWNRVERRYCR